MPMRDSDIVRSLRRNIRPAFAFKKTFFEVLATKLNVGRTLKLGFSAGFRSQAPVLRLLKTLVCIRYRFSDAASCGRLDGP